MKKIKKNNLIGLGGSLLFILLIFILPLNREILLLLNLSIMLFTLWRTRLSIISLWSIITNYVMINVYAYDVTGIAYGILGMTTISFVPMLQYMMILNLSFYFWASSTNFLLQEKKLLNYSGYKPTKGFTAICSIIAILAILIAFPTIPFVFNAGNRFEALLPGNAWNHLSVVALLFIMPNIRKCKFVICTYVFVIFWFLSHYERVDVIGIILALAYIYIASNRSKKIEWKKVFRIGILGIIVFFVLSLIGETRMSSTFSFSKLFEKLLKQNTASDVGFMYDLAIKYTNDHELLHGVSYLRYIFKFIPGMDLNYLETTNILSQYTSFVPGGSFILNEPLMNFGMIGVIIIPNILMWMVYILLKKETKIRYIVFIFLVATPFRYLWYGIEYIETAIVIFIPGLYLVYKCLRMRSVQ